MHRKDVSEVGTAILEIQVEIHAISKGSFSAIKGRKARILGSALFFLTLPAPWLHMKLAPPYP